VNFADNHTRPRLAVHKFSSCDGCQLALLNAGESLLLLAEKVELVHFVEAGVVNEMAECDIALIEGSVSTPQEMERIKHIRAHTQYLVTIGACATAGGIQALRNYADGQQWINSIYAQPEYIASLSTVTPIAAHVRVDFELWGCPINTKQVLAMVQSLLLDVTPVDVNDSVCIDCKRQGNNCVLVTQQEPCLGPVTRTGCGALCPQFGRACYGCYGPQENPNVPALRQRFEGLGLAPEIARQRFQFITSTAPAFASAAKKSDVT